MPPEGQSRTKSNVNAHIGKISLLEFLLPVAVAVHSMHWLSCHAFRASDTQHDL
jgi:hypothetical protein